MHKRRAPTDADDNYMISAGRDPGDMDVFAETDGAYATSEDEEEQGITQQEQETAQRRADKLYLIAEKVLTPAQFTAFRLLGIECLTQAAAALEMNVTQQRVAQLWEKARTKLQEHYSEVYEQD